MAPPIKRRKLYAADAVERSTGLAFITAVVINVLLFPSSAPATITAVMTSHCVDVQIPIASSNKANKINMANMDLMVPKRCCSFGAMITEVTASNNPQPRNTNPSPCSFNPKTNGANASKVKNPKLYKAAAIPNTNSERCFSARNGSSKDVFFFSIVI